MTKLKTLKDLKRRWEYDAGLDAVVPFKRGKPIGCSNDIVIFDELRFEAIKWVKESKKLMKEGLNAELNEYSWLLFFNIKEEELSK